MDDEDVRRLLALKSEGPNLDYKAGFEWSKTNRDLKYELVRDLMALANTKDGGRIVFGVREPDHEFIGVTAEISASIDPSDVVSMLHDNAAPKVRCAIYRREIDGKRVIVFDVAEFEETPIICTKTINSNVTKRGILREGAVYVRTGAATTQEASADEMRSLLERAVRRRKDEMLRAMNDILTGRRTQLTPSAAELYQPEIMAAEEFLKTALRQA
jgi:predicted HTH transcriptional regulator